ncbi:MAG: 4-hydroxy-tetrahydrodipicolinate reductase [Verrucomicrobiae bacterium]|nr:4-hydroxy-tetrahydrodipicolinate reductase [Verrucomicrobiae bacterium]
MTKILINGSKGRMGQALLTCAARTSDLLVTAGIDVGDDLSAALPGTDVLIDFSFHSVTPKVVRLCAERGIAAVVGTTGLGETEKTALHEAASRIPIVFATNFSTGVNTLFWLTRKAAEILGPSFDLEVVEMHHRHKKDAPSGTATTLLETLAAVRQWQLDQVLRHGRAGIVGERPSAEIGVHALRGGDVVGDHTVIYAGNGERLELTHKASSRETFATGALRAARWVFGKPPGLYDMQDVLGLH